MVKEVMAQFLHILAHDLKKRTIQAFFARSGETEIKNSQTWKKLDLFGLKLQGNSDLLGCMCVHHCLGHNSSFKHQNWAILQSMRS